MPADNTIEIRITGVIDRSLEASTTKAIAQLGKVAAASEAWSAKFDTPAASTQHDVAAKGIGRLPDQADMDLAKEANAQAEAWKSANREILSAEDSLVRDMFSKRQNLVLDLARIGEQFIEKEIANDLKYWTERGLLALEGVEKEKAVEQGGLLQTLLFNQIDFASKAASEAAKTGATAAGVTARVTAEAAGSAAGKAIKAVETTSSITADAAKGAAGAYSALAGIPIIGPALGAAAAVVTFAAIEAYGALASFDVGTMNVPFDQLAMVHKGEIIIPAGPSETIRSGRGGFSMPSVSNVANSGGNVTHNWTYAPQNTIHAPSGVEALRDDESEFVDFVGGLIRSGRLKLAA